MAMAAKRARPRRAASSRTSSGQSAISRPCWRVDRPSPGDRVDYPDAQRERLPMRPPHLARSRTNWTKTGVPSDAPVFGVAQGAAVAQTQGEIFVDESPSADS